MRSPHCDFRSARQIAHVTRVAIWLLPLLGLAGHAGAANVAPAATGPAAPLASTAADGLVTRTQARSSAAPPSLNVGSVIVAEPAMETPLPIQVGPADGLPKNSFVRIRGLPASVSLSEGHSIAPGSWAVPFVGLPTLRISVPVGLSGTSDVTVALVTVDGIVLAEAKSSLVITTASSLGKAEPQPKSVASIGPATSGLPSDRGSQSRPSPPPQPPRTEAQQRALRFITRGNEQLRDGDVAAARLFYQRAVDAGLPEGALAMAASYDQIELDRLGVRGMTGDRDAARKWYERARQMGATEADDRLRRLGGR